MVKDPDCLVAIGVCKDIDSQIFEVLNEIVLDKNKFIRAYKDLFGDNNSVHSKSIFEKRLHRR